MATECASRVLPLADFDRVPPQPKPRRISSSKSTPDADSLLFLHVRTSNSEQCRKNPIHVGKRLSSLVLSYTGLPVFSCSHCPPTAPLPLSAAIFKNREDEVNQSNRAVIQSFPCPNHSVLNLTHRALVSH